MRVKYMFIQKPVMTDILPSRCLKRYLRLSYMVAIAMEGLCCMSIYLLHSFSLLVPFSVVYGYFDGAYVALIAVVTSDVVGPTYLTSALGVVYFLHAIPYLISPPIGGKCSGLYCNCCSVVKTKTKVSKTLVVITHVDLDNLTYKP